MGKHFKFADPRTILEIYYSNPNEIGNAEISKLFCGAATSTIARYKKSVHSEMIKRGIHTWNKYNVNTKIAFEVWGIDVAELEKCLIKMNKLNLGGRL